MEQHVQLLPNTGKRGGSRNLSRDTGDVLQVDGNDGRKQKVVTDDSVIHMSKKRAGSPGPVTDVLPKVVGVPEELSSVSSLGNVLAQQTKVSGKRAMSILDSNLLPGSVDAVDAEIEDQRDRRRKTIRKHFTEQEQQMYSDLLRRHVKLCNFEEIQTALNSVIPERFSMEQKSALASSTYSNLAVQYSRIRKTQIKMLQSDVAATRWLDEVAQQQMLDPALKSKELDDRIAEAAKYLAARAISKTSPFFKPTDEELDRSKKLIKKWMNPTKRHELLLSLAKPRRGGSELASSK